MMTDSSFAESTGAKARGEEQRAEEVRLDVGADFFVGVGKDARARHVGSGVVDQHSDVTGCFDCCLDGAGSVTSRVSGTMRSSSQLRGGPGRGVDLACAAGKGVVDEVRSDAAVCSGDEDDCSIN